MKKTDISPDGPPSTSTSTSNNQSSPSASFSEVVITHHHPPSSSSASQQQQSLPAAKESVTEEEDQSYSHQSQTAEPPPPNFFLKKKEGSSFSSSSSSSIESLLGQLDLHTDTEEEKPPVQMFTAVAAIFFEQQQHATRHRETLNPPGGTSDWQAILEGADTSYRAAGHVDLRALQLVRSILDSLWLDGPEDDLVKASRILANASREPRWRIPFREGGILDFFLEIVATEDVSIYLNLEALRLIGNACANEDTNRESVVSQGFILPIIKQLRNNTLAKLVIPVLYNICIDYEPAQEAIRSKLFCPLIDVLARESFDYGPLLGYICPLLNFSLEQYDANQSPDYTVRVLLQVALGPPEVEVEDQVSLVNAITTHLQIDRFQRILIEEDLVKLPLLIIIRSFQPAQPAPSSSSHSSLLSITLDPFFPPSTIREGADEEEKVSSSVRNSLIGALSDVSANPGFGVKYPVDSDLIKSLIGWLSASHPQLQICSCIMLGNHARSDLVCHSMVHDLRIHETLASIVQDSSDTQVLHAALGFLRNLALPLANKALLGQANIIEIISRFWSMDFTPQLQYSAVSLLRQLLNSSFVNVQRLLVSLSADPDSPAHDKTYLSILLSLFEKTDQGPTRVEIGRTIAAIWRCVSSSSSSSNNPSSSSSSSIIVDPVVLAELLHRLYSKHANNIARPLAMMVTQSQWPIIKSEGWFALALMARSSKEGSAAVNAILQQVEVFGALVETVTGHSISNNAPPAPTTATASAGTEEPISIESSSLTTTTTNAVRRTPSSDYSDYTSNAVAVVAASAEKIIPTTTTTSRSSTSSSTTGTTTTTIAARNRENALILINELLRNSGDDMSPIRHSVLEDLLHGRQSDLGFQELMLRAQSLE